jgi:hypothetical protein
MTGRREFREVAAPGTRDALDLVLVDSIDEVFDAAFGTNGSTTNGRVQAPSTKR